MKTMTMESPFRTITDHSPSVRHIAPFLTSFTDYSDSRCGTPGTSKHDACAPKFENDVSDLRLSPLVRIISEGRGANVTFTVDIP